MTKARGMCPASSLVPGTPESIENAKSPGPGHLDRLIPISSKYHSGGNSNRNTKPPLVPTSWWGFLPFLARPRNSYFIHENGGPGRPRHKQDVNICGWWGRGAGDRPGTSARARNRSLRLRKGDEGSPTNRQMGCSRRLGNSQTHLEGTEVPNPSPSGVQPARAPLPKLQRRCRWAGPK